MCSIVSKNTLAIWLILQTYKVFMSLFSSPSEFMWKQLFVETQVDLASTDR